MKQKPETMIRASSPAFEKRRSDVWAFLRKTLEDRKLRDGKLSPMNERTLASAIANTKN